MPRPETRGRRAAGVAIGAAVLLAPHAAAAHVALKEMGSFWSGVLYPLTSPDQLGFLLGLAILASFQRRRRDAWLVCAVFAGGAVGSLVDYTAGWPADAGASMAGLMILVGLAGAVCLQVGTTPLVGLASAGGSIVGGTGAVGVGGSSLVLFALGVSITLASVLSYSLIGTANVRIDWQRIALRAGASWIAAIGVMLLAFAGTQLIGHR